MSYLELPRFPRGFLFADHPIESPPTFIPGPLLPNFYVHEWTEIESAGDEELFVVVMGHCLSLSKVQNESPANELLEALRCSEYNFFTVLNRFSGRHAVIFGNRHNPKVVNDATGMRAVFYAGEGGIISSHALLVERALGSVPHTDQLPFQYGYPGNRTPHLRTKLLTPNTYYEITENKVRRFWPTVSPEKRPVEDVASECLEAATNALRNMAQGQAVKMALTAGLDSRVILALGLHSGIEFTTYTYGHGNDTLLDREFAKDLARRHEVAHEVVPRLQNSSELNRRLDEVNYATHHKRNVAALMRWFADPSAVAVTGNLLEIGRSFYKSSRDRGVEAPTSAQTMHHLHRRHIGRRINEQIDSFGEKHFEHVSLLGYQSYIEDSEFSSQLGLLDPFDQFYWEHRMSAWHGVSMNERDFYGLAFIPFNARCIFEAMLGVSMKARDESQVFHKMIQMVDPSLTELPINPKTWPLR